MIDAVFQPQTHQTVYRRLLMSTSYPGDLVQIGDLALEGGVAVAVLASLLDNTVSFFDVDAQLDELTRRYLGAREASLGDADFILACGEHAPSPDFTPKLGELVSPEFGATLVLTGKRVGEGEVMLELSGPGVEGVKIVRLSGFHPNWFEVRERWVASFPLGVDLVLVDRANIVSLPRTTRIIVLRGN